MVYRRLTRSGCEMAKTKRCNSMILCPAPPMTNTVFPTTFGYVEERTDKVPIRVKMAWCGAGSPVNPAMPEDRRGMRVERAGAERPHPAPSPEVPAARHRPTKAARSRRCARSTDSTFYSPQTKLVFLKDVSAVHYRPRSKPRFLLLFLLLLVLSLLPPPKKLCFHRRFFFVC